MEIKTRTCFPIEQYRDDPNYETLIPDIYNGERSACNLTDKRVRNLVCQMKE